MTKMKNSIQHTFFNLRFDWRLRLGQIIVAKNTLVLVIAWQSLCLWMFVTSLFIKNVPQLSKPEIICFCITSQIKLIIHRIFLKSQRHVKVTCTIESVQDFLIKLDMKPCTYASIGNKHFYTKSCHHQTYQNYEQSRQKLGRIFENKVCTLKIKLFNNIFQ